MFALGCCCGGALLLQLYDAQSSWKLYESELESKVEDLTEEREQLQAQLEDISGEVCIPCRLAPAPNAARHAFACVPAGTRPQGR